MSFAEVFSQVNPMVVGSKLASTSEIGSPAPSLRAAIAARKIDEVIKVEANMTFHPNFVSKPSEAASKIVIANRFHHLYDDAVRRKSFNSLTRPAENSFKPSISPKAMKMRRERKAAESISSLHTAIGAGRKVEVVQVQEHFHPTVNKRKSTDKLSPAEASERLYSSRGYHQELVETKVAELDGKHAEACSFSPTLTAKSPSRRLSNTQEFMNLSVAERLLYCGQQKNDKLAAAIQVRKEKEIGGLTFQPTLVAVTPRKSNASKSKSAESSPRTSAGSRFEHLYQDAINRKLEEPIRMKEAQDLTFTPCISAHAKASSEKRSQSDLVMSLHTATGSGRGLIIPPPIDTNTYKPAITMLGHTVERNTDGSSISDYLYGLKETQKTNEAILKYEADIRLSEACTFSPEISKKSRSASFIAGEEDVGVVERLLGYGEEKKKKLHEDQVTRNSLGAIEATFMPKINSPGKAEIGSPRGDQFERLYTDAIKRQTEDPFVRAKFDESHMTFHPVISDLANSIDKSTFASINLRTQELAAKKRDEMGAIRTAESVHTFSPCITRRASDIEGDEFDEINQHQKELSEIKKNKTQRDIDEENTFSPKLVSSHKSPSGSANVSTSESIGSESLTTPTSPSGILGLKSSESPLNRRTSDSMLNRLFPVSTGTDNQSDNMTDSSSDTPKKDVMDNIMTGTSVISSTTCSPRGGDKDKDLLSSPMSVSVNPAEAEYVGPQRGQGAEILARE